jgi:hypothetical protein
MRDSNSGDVAANTLSKSAGQRSGQAAIVLTSTDALRLMLCERCRTLADETTTRSETTREALSSSGEQPLVILLRPADHLTPDQQSALPAANLSAVSDELRTGALVSIARGWLRIRLRSVRVVG